VASETSDKTGHTAGPQRLAAAVLALAWLLPGCKHGTHASPAASSSAATSAALSSSAPTSIQSAIPAATEIAETGAPEQKGPANPIGENVQAADYRMKLVSVKECRSKEYYHPRPGNMWLGVEVKLESTSDHELRVSPFYATLHDSQHRSYTPTFDGCHPVLDSMRMKKDDKAHGWITFELPRDATGMHLVYDPFVVGGPRQPLEFLVVR